MPPALTPRRLKQQRENQFFDVGVQGRKTGITLKENARDEHGIENLDGIFSSPEKPSPKRRTRNGNTTLTSSSMKVAQSSEQDPIHVLSERRLLKSTRTTLPPPSGRSPYKTNIGSSPRRQSSPHKTPEPALSKRAVKRRLDFNADEPRPSIEFSPVKEPMKGPLYASRDRTELRTDVYDLQPSPSVGSKRRRDSEPVEEQPEEADEPYLNGFDDDDQAPLYDKDDDEMIDANFEAPVEQSPISSPIKQQVKKKGRKSNDNDATINPALLTKKQLNSRTRPEFLDSNAAANDEEPAIAGASKARKKRTSNGTRNAQKNASDQSILTEGESSIMVPPANDPSPAPPKRGRGRKNASKTKVKVHQDLVIGETSELPPAKKAKTSKSSAPKERDANVMLPPPLRPTKTPSVEPHSCRSASMSPSKRAGASRSLTILREGTPAEDPSIRRTRSGRQVIKPLEYWLGERSDRDPDGTLVGVVRAESVEIAPRQYSRRSTVASRRSRAPSSTGGQRGSEDTPLGVIREEGYGDEETQLEEWEAEGGVIRGFVRTWDDMLNAADETDMREQDLAFSSNSIETKDVAGSDFKYAKFLSLPFFGCGMVDIPAGGYKRAKNSRKMQMVFFVHKGKVLVTVGEAEFSISKGGVWHVPRGNIYSIENKWEQPARIFFAQGCETLEESG